MKDLVQQPNAKDDKITKIIDRVLTQIFGKEASSLIYKHLERNYSVRRNEVGEKLELFAEGLETFLKSGAYVIERKILDDIWSSYDEVRRLQVEKPRREGSFVSELKVLLREA
jgi:ribosomal protein L5